MHFNQSMTVTQMFRFDGLTQQYLESCNKMLVWMLSFPLICATNVCNILIRFDWEELQRR